MKTPEQILHDFYTYWMSERDSAMAGDTEGNFVIHYGLCTSLTEWLDTKAVGDELWSETVTLQCQKLTTAYGEDPESTTPFNTDFAEYKVEKRNNTCHLNAKRVAFVERMLKELAP